MQTNIDRTVHISHKAVELPGEAKSDLGTRVLAVQHMLT